MSNNNDKNVKIKSPKISFFNMSEELCDNSDSKINMEKNFGRKTKFDVKKLNSVEIKSSKNKEINNSINLIPNMNN